MDATAKVDLYLLKGGKETDDYTSRRLACSEAVLVGLEKGGGWWKFTKPSLLVLGLEEARVHPSLLIPRRGYRVDFNGQEGQETSYYRLLHYMFASGNIYLKMESL